MALGHDSHDHPPPNHTYHDLNSNDVDPKKKETSSVGLKRIAPYWHPYNTMAKGRWFNREILELVSTEFRDRSIEYYVRQSIKFYPILSTFQLYDVSDLLWSLVSPR